MSFSPTATRRNINRNSRNGFSPNRSPAGRELSPSNYNYNNHNNSRTPSPQPHTRPKRQTNDNVSETTKPLLQPDGTNPQPPLAGPEIDDLDSDDRETVHINQPGVDDGFFLNGERGVEDNNPEAENIPEKPKEPESLYPDEIPDIDVPDIATRAGDPHPRHPDFPYAPGYGPEVYNIPDYAPTEFGGGSETIPDVNVYQHKKTLAQGMMDLALFSANANQLRYVLESYNRHPYYYPSIILISLSLLFQIAVGVGLIWNATYNVKDKKEICKANKINNFTIIGIFLVTVINVFISAFGVANAPTSS